MTVGYRGAEITTFIHFDMMFGVQVKTPETIWDVKGHFFRNDEALAAGEAAMDRFIATNGSNTVCV